MKQELKRIAIYDAALMLLVLLAGAVTFEGSVNNFVPLITGGFMFITIINGIIGVFFYCRSSISKYQVRCHGVATLLLGAIALLCSIFLLADLKGSLHC